MAGTFETISCDDNVGGDHSLLVFDVAGDGSQIVFVRKEWRGDDGANWSYAAATGGIINTTTAVTIKTAAGSGIRNYVESIEIMSEALTNATEVAIRDGAAGTVLWRIKIPTAGMALTSIKLSPPLKGTANTLLEVVTLTASGAGAVYFNAHGFTAA